MTSNDDTLRLMMEVGMSMLLLRPTMMMTTQGICLRLLLLPLPGELYLIFHYFDLEKENE